MPSNWLAQFGNYHSLACYSFAPYPKPREGVELSSADWNLWWIVQSFKRGTERCRHIETGEWIAPEKYVAASIDRECQAALSDRTLVPVPGHDVTPCTTDDARSWPGLRMAVGLYGRYHNRVTDALRRVVAIPQSSKTKSLAERASVAQQVASLRVDVSGLGPKVALVDDTLTSGTTCMGALQALRNAGYSGDVIAFTVGHVIELEDPRAFHFRCNIKWFDTNSHAHR